MNSSKKRRTTTQAVTQNAQFYIQPTAVSDGSPPVVRRLFEVNSEPHTGARPSVRLCVGLIMRIGFLIFSSPGAILVTGRGLGERV